MKKYFIIGLVIFVIIVAIVVCLLLHKNKFVIHSLKRLSYSYTTGNMINSSVRYDIECGDTCHITIKPDGVDDLDAKEYEFSNEKVKRVIDVLNQYHVSNWDGFDKSDPYVLDGNSFHFSLDTKKGESISASGYMMWPKDYRKVKESLESIFLEGIELEEKGD